MMRISLPMALMLPGFIFGVASAPAWADEPAKFDLVIHEHRFEPAELHLPAGRPILLVVQNQDPAAEEFESSALKVEKVVGGGQTLVVRLRPLAPGRYPFFGEYHPDTALGAVVAE